MPLPPPLPPQRRPAVNPGTGSAPDPLDDPYLDEFEEPEPPRRHGLANVTLVMGILALTGTITMMVLMADVLASGRDIESRGENDPVVMMIVLGVIAGVICTPTGLIMGIVALVQIARPHPPRTGKGAAIWGIVLCCLTILAFVIGIAVLMNWGKRNRSRVMEDSDIRQIALASSTIAIINPDAGRINSFQGNADP